MCLNIDFIVVTDCCNPYFTIFNLCVWAERVGGRGVDGKVRWNSGGMLKGASYLDLFSKHLILGTSFTAKVYYG